MHIYYIQCVSLKILVTKYFSGLDFIEMVFCRIIKGVLIIHILSILKMLNLIMVCTYVIKLTFTLIKR